MSGYELSPSFFQSSVSKTHFHSTSVGMDFVRTVVEPVKQAALAEKMHGFWDDFHHVNAEVRFLSCP